MPLCRKVFKFRMEPTELEADELGRIASVARFVFNWGLDRCQSHYQEHGKSMPWTELSAELTQLKKNQLWMYDFDSQMQQQALADLRREVCATTVEWLTTAWASSVVNHEVRDRACNATLAR